jgi:hypothetical protein
MLKTLKALPLLTLFFFAAVPALHAATSITTLTCTDVNGNVGKYPVYAYTIDYGSGGDFVSFYTTNGYYNSFLIAEIFGTTYTTCAFGSIGNVTFGSLSISNVTSAGVNGGNPVYANAGDGPTASSPISYAGVTLSYNSLSVGQNGTNAKFDSEDTTQKLSPEERKKALADHLARGLALPKVSQ